MSNMALGDVYSDVMKTTHDFISRFPWDNKSAYAAWLEQSYYFVRNSTRLLALACSRAELHENALHRRMADHLKEETGHEKLALLDLKALNSDFVLRSEFTETRALYQTQYYWIEHRSALSFLGYILFLEGLASTQGPKILSIAEKTYGTSCVHFLKVHAEEDQSHIQKALTLAQQSIAENKDTTILDLVLNMQSSCHFYKLILDRILSP